MDIVKTMVALEDSSVIINKMIVICQYECRGSHFVLFKCPKTYIIKSSFSVPCSDRVGYSQFGVVEFTTGFGDRYILNINHSAYIILSDEWFESDPFRDGILENMAGWALLGRYNYGYAGFLTL